MLFPDDYCLAARAERVSEWLPRDAPPLAFHAEHAGGRHGHSAARLLVTHKPVEVPDGGALPQVPGLIHALRDRAGGCTVRVLTFAPSE